jgi:hypothetical protein
VTAEKQAQERSLLLGDVVIVCVTPAITWLQTQDWVVGDGTGDGGVMSAAFMTILHMGDWRFRLFDAFIAYWCG